MSELCEKGKVGAAWDAPSQDIFKQKKAIGTNRLEVIIRFGQSKRAQTWKHMVITVLQHGSVLNSERRGIAYGSGIFSQTPAAAGEQIL